MKTNLRVILFMLMAFCGQQTFGQWTQVFFDDFEEGYKYWHDGGADCKQTNKGLIYGAKSTRLIGDSESSMVYSDSMQIAAYGKIKVDFVYKTSGYASGDQFALEVSTDNGTTYTEFKKWVFGTDIQNNEEVKAESVTVTDIVLTDLTRLLFRGKSADATNGFVVLDSVDVSVSGPPVVGIAANNLESLKVYPNPASDYVNIDFGSFSQANSRVSLYDMTGKTLINVLADTRNFQLDTKNVKSGMYLLKVVSGTQSQVSKLQIK